MTIHDLETPAVLIDAATLDRNLRRMATYCDTRGLRLRPHAKTHKIPEIAHLQLKYGSQGITVAKLAEAEVMADAGIDDILILYPLWGEKKWSRLVELARCARISVAIDSLAVAAGISQAATTGGVEIGLRVEFDTGFRRCGLPIEDKSIDVVRTISAFPGIRWEGVSVYPGHIMGDRESRERDIILENDKLDRLLTLLDSANIPCPVVSGGNTPAAFESHRFHGVTEIRPGTYVFNDRNTVDAKAINYTDCALTVLATVVSTSVPFRAIIDAGSKTLSADALLSGERKHFGYIPDYPKILVEELSEEHGHLAISDNSAIAVGSRVRIIPNHACTCINLQDRVFVVSGDQVVDEWRVAARGKST